MNKRQQIEKLTGHSFSDEHWEALSAWWDATRGLPLDRQKMLWKAAFKAYEIQRRQDLPFTTIRTPSTSTLTYANIPAVSTFTVNSPTRTFTWPMQQKVPWYRRVLRLLANR